MTTPKPPTTAIGSDGRVWNVRASDGQLWRYSDAQDGSLIGCYLEDDMRSPAQKAADQQAEEEKFQRDMREANGEDCPDGWP